MLQINAYCRKGNFFPFVYAGPHLKAWNKNQDTWWKGRRRALISGENFGKRKAENPRAHWQPKSREARRPTQLRREIVRSQRSVGLGMSVRCFNLVFVFRLLTFLLHLSYLCNVYMLGFGGLGLLWLSKAAWNIEFVDDIVPLLAIVIKWWGMAWIEHWWI